MVWLDRVDLVRLRQTMKQSKEGVPLSKVVHFFKREHQKKKKLFGQNEFFEGGKLR